MHCGLLVRVQITRISESCGIPRAAASTMFDQWILRARNGLGPLVVASVGRLSRMRSYDRRAMSADPDKMVPRGVRPTLRSSRRATSAFRHPCGARLNSEAVLRS